MPGNKIQVLDAAAGKKESAEVMEEVSVKLIFAGHFQVAVDKID